MASEAIVIALCLSVNFSFETFLKLLNEFQRDVPFVNLYQPPSRNFDPLKNMGFVGRAYFFLYCIYREYVYSVAIYQKYLMSLGN